MKIFVQTILPAPLVGPGIVIIREFEFTREILELLKDIDYQKYENFTFYTRDRVSFPYYARQYRFYRYAMKGDFADCPE